MDLIAELKPHLEILEKVMVFEQKKEFNKFLLVLTITGFITIFGGWIEYAFYRLFGISSIFFIWGQTGQSELTPTAEPVLFFSIWLIYLVPILSIVIFTLGSPGFINWNKSYRIVGIITIMLFFFTHITVLTLGVSNSKLIPGVWGTMICIGLLITSRILSAVISTNLMQNGLVMFAIVSFGLGLISVVLVEETLGMFFFCCILGLLLTISGMITYIKIGKVNISTEGDI
ncbi:MAG: hypothetical protein ACXACU_07750 [Candidatus Hodarchaeales archaeon]